MALTWNSVKPWLERNPFQTAALKPYIPSQETVSGGDDLTDTKGWTRVAVSPATPLSAILLAQDTLYAASSANSRRALLRDELTDLQEKAMLLLKGRQWPVRKTAEGLAAVGLEEGRASAWPAQGWRALCALRECQLVVLNEDKKQIQFYPEDVRTWSKDIETIFVEYEARFIWHMPQVSQIGFWLSTQETDGWLIEWPVAEGTMDELKASANKHNLVIPPKCNKESLTKRVGRAEAVRVFSEWAQ
jgi:hypothetical protein